MASDGANRPGRGTGDNPSEAELSERLRRLGERLGPERAEADVRPASSAGTGSDPNGIGKAMRLSSEFIAGIIAGFGIGWLGDRLLGTSPWGMIVFLMLGFVAGIMNVMRSAGMLGRSLPGKK
ncbi:AtpZ/AtpI family protein [Labrys wisconsinensis]|uniref:ATP synthase protein I n=1 Tax=Labrys wisconsinensis TaxID=425677 RepID=A0ABU0J8A1_9HYPH|nr:AtpZ/AtpI family protein [Labrys wisconsinensis]MDQ0470500.1 ATP synthase protein I [Labrys wisconsinensis]